MRGVLFAEAPYAAGAPPVVCTGLQSAELVRVQTMLEIRTAAECAVESH